MGTELARLLSTGLERHRVVNDTAGGHNLRPPCSHIAGSDYVRLVGSSLLLLGLAKYLALVQTLLLSGFLSMALAHSLMALVGVLVKQVVFDKLLARIRPSLHGCGSVFQWRLVNSWPRCLVVEPQSPRLSAWAWCGFPAKNPVVVRLR